ILHTRQYAGGQLPQMPEPGETFYFTPEFPKSPHLENAVLVQVMSISQERDSISLGVKFDPTQPMAVRETVAHMIFGDSASWEAVRARRNKSMGLLRGMSYVLGLSFKGIYHTLRALAKEPARLARQKKREAEVIVVEAQPAHLLAFGEAFDPVPAQRPVSMLQAAIEQNRRRDEDQAGRGPAHTTGTDIPRGAV
ncbi:MAG: hypothetical protein R3D60_12780, partial [Paracoccaceae bacterium]